MSTHCLLHVLSETFPHRRHPLPIQRAFLANTVAVVEYAPSLVEKTVELVVDRLIQIDVRSLHPPPPRA
jgi:hypothetical protein